MTHLPPPPAGTLGIVIAGDQQGIPWVNTFWATSAVTATPTRTQMDSLATALLGSYQAQFRAMMHTLCNVISCSVEYQVSADSVIPGLFVNSLAGTRAGGTGPGSTCGVISWHTDYDHYRGGHARSYVPGPVTGDISTVANFTTTYAAALLAKATAWRGAVNAYSAAPFTAVTFARLARIRDKQPIDPPVLRPIVGESVKQAIGTQRRRLT